MDRGYKWVPGQRRHRPQRSVKGSCAWREEGPQKGLGARPSTFQRREVTHGFSSGLTKEVALDSGLDSGRSDVLRWRKVFPGRGQLRNQQSCLAERRKTWQGAVGWTLSREWDMLCWAGRGFRCTVGWPVERFCSVSFLRSKRRTQRTEQTGEG